MSKIIGIDLGTTNSAVAVMEGGEAKVIPNKEGNRTTPSVVAFKGDERIVGLSAKNQAITNKDTISSIKRHMGEDYHVTVEGKDYTPQEISAIILQSLKEDAESYLGESVTKAVITVPAYFNDTQRQATKDAGKIAGLDVERIINEPTAAALAYGLDKTEQDKTVMVYDLGGGTFDVSILELGGGVFEVISTSGDNRLGGDDFDQVLIDWLATEIQNNYGLDVRNDQQAMQRLKQESEKTKKDLSSVSSVHISLPFIGMNDNGPVSVEFDITQAKFNEMTKQLVERTLGPVRQALKDADLTKNDIDEVILVGGSTRIPAVQEAIQKEIGKAPSKSVNPDEVVAQGAAIQGGILAGDVSDVVLLDVTPLSLGVETEGGINTILIERNTTIPASKSQTFTTGVDNQPSATINVLQGERPMARDNKSLGSFNVEIPAAPRGVPQIEVTYAIDANGIINVTAKDLATNKENSITITSTTNLSDEEIERFVKEAEANAEADKKRKEEAETLNAAEQTVYSIDKTISDAGDSISSDEKTQLSTLKDELQGLLDSETKDIEAIQAKQKQIEDLVQPIVARMYEQAAQANQAAQAGSDNAGQSTDSDEEVIEAEYEDK